MTPFFKKGTSYPNDKIHYVKPHIGKCFKCGNPVIYNPKIEVNDYIFTVIGFTMRSSKDQLHICNSGEEIS